MTARPPRVSNGSGTTAVVRNAFLAFVRVHILHHAAEASFFGLELIEQLGRHGYSLSPGTLYPVLHELEQSGLLRSRAEVARGKMRQYHRATAKRRRTLEKARRSIRELAGEILE